jgi:2,3-bisphosphoglycerate-dependent phosphoglycerate mutase
MSETTLVVIRHGETEWNVLGRLQGHSDTPLNAVGVLQAAATAERLVSDPSFRPTIESVDAVVSSDLLRARSTAESISKAIERSRGGAPVPFEVDAGLRETHLGRWQGMNWEAVKEVDGEHVKKWKHDPFASPPGGGESAFARYSRVTECLAKLAERHRGRTVVVVSHGGCLDDVARLCTGVPFGHSTHRWKPNAAINVVTHSTDEREDSFMPALVPPAAGAEEDTTESVPSTPAEASEPTSATTPREQPLSGVHVLCTPTLRKLGGSWRVDLWGVASHLERDFAAEAGSKDSSTVGGFLFEDAPASAGPRDEILFVRDE